MQSIKISLNPSLYPLDVIYAASYVFLDKAYIFLDGDIHKEITVTITPKKDAKEDNLKGEFMNELINYAAYKTQSEKNKDIRDSILQRALITNDPALLDEDTDVDKLLEELDDEEFLDDPEGIAIPWEEKYGKAEK